MNIKMAINSQLPTIESKKQTKPWLVWLTCGVWPGWIECWPVNQRVTGSIPSWGACLGCGPGPQLGACEGQQHVDVSLPLFLLPFPSL